MSSTIYSPFSKSAKYYDLLYAQKDYEQEVEIIQKIILECNTTKKQDILDLGCGTGKHSLLLSKLGYNVIGVDRSKQMLSIARKNSNKAKHKPTFILADLRRYKHPRLFTVVLSLFHVLSYQISDVDVFSFFTSIETNLKPGGIGIFDFWHGPGILMVKPEIRIRTIRSDRCIITKKKKPKVNEQAHTVSVTHTITIFDTQKHTESVIREKHCMRYFFIQEIISFLKKVNLELVYYGGMDYPLKSISDHDWDVWFVVKKPLFKKMIT